MMNCRKVCAGIDQLFVCSAFCGFVNCTSLKALSAQSAIRALLAFSYAYDASDWTGLE